MPEETSWVKEFTKCPECGSENRMFEQMGQELKDRGVAKEDMKFYFDMKNGALANQEIMAKLPIGGELPAFATATDICTDCGCIYAVRLERTNAKKGLAPVQLATNRAQRRAGMTGGRGFQLPPLNNPLLR
jgi:hypothetical protein